MKKTALSVKQGVQLESQLITLAGMQAASFQILKRDDDENRTITGHAPLFVTIHPPMTELDEKSRRPHG